MKKTINKYTVNTKRVLENNNDKSYKVFEDLKLARKFAGEQLRIGNFKSLLNFKRIPLSI